MTRLIHSGQARLSACNRLKMIVPETMYTTLIGSGYGGIDINAGSVLQRKTSAITQLYHQVGRLPEGKYLFDSLLFNFFKTEYRVPTSNGNVTIQVISVIYLSKTYPIVLKLPDNGVWRPFIISNNMMELSNDAGLGGFKTNILEGIPFLCNIVSNTKYDHDQFFLLNGGIIPIVGLHRIGNRLVSSFMNNIVVDPAEMCQYIIGPSVGVRDVMGILAALPVTFIDTNILAENVTKDTSIMMNDILYDALMRFFIIPIGVDVYQDEWEYNGSVYDAALVGSYEHGVRDDFYEIIDEITVSIITDGLYSLYPELSDYDTTMISYDSLNEEVTIEFSDSNNWRSDVVFSYDLMTLVMFNPSTRI